jgi:S1-C subfamily serine protease
VPDEPPEFDDDADLDGHGALLPPDDRIWRHPSEMGALTEDRSRRPAVAATPGRAGSWSAGLAGALLATGIVLVATHIATAMGPTASASRGSSGPAAQGTKVVLTTEASMAPNDETNVAHVFGTVPSVVTTGKVGQQLAQTVTRVYDATVMVQSTQGTSTVQGAGLVIGADCLVVVAASLVRAGASTDLTLSDGRLVAAQLVGEDPDTGIAVLRCDADGLVTIPDDSEAASPDEMVVLVYNAPHAIGMGFGLVTAVEQHVSAGGGNTLIDELETDIAPTDEGSAIVDGDGDVMGIVVGSVHGISIATPTWLAVSVARQIASAGHAGRAWLGIDGADVLASGQQGGGVRVMAVLPGGAAAVAGIQAGDLIRSIDGQATDSLSALQARLYTLQPGSRAVIDVLRGGRDVAEHARLQAAPAA